jgi:hypothetical protein
LKFAAPGNEALTAASLPDIRGAEVGA